MHISYDNNFSLFSPLVKLVYYKENLIRANQCCLTTWVTIGQNQQKLKQNWLIEQLYETKLVEKQVKMSHRITRIPCYGTKPAVVEAKMALRSAI